MNQMQYQASGALQTSDERQMGLFLHISQLLNLFVPFGGYIAPIAIWQIKKEEMPALDVHGKMAVNWMFSEFIYLMVSVLLMLILVGFLTFFVVLALGLIFPIIGAIKASNGEHWEYPLTIKFLK